MQDREAPATRRRSFGERLAGAALLHVDTYEEVEADTTATLESAGVVALVAAAIAIGKLETAPLAIVTTILFVFVGWMIWAGLTYLIGDKLLGGTATWGELLRTLGFAQGPRLLLVGASLPKVGLLVQLVVLVWILFTSVVALRQALDFGTGRAILTGGIGLVILELLRIFT